MLVVSSYFKRGLSIALPFLLALLLVLNAGANSSRGIRVEIQTATGEKITLYKESHALLIGVSGYTEGWPKLPGVKADIAAVRVLLENNGF